MRKNSVRWPVRSLGALLVCILAVPMLCGQELPNLPPLTPQDIALKEVPGALGAPAVILYYAVETDNTKSSETRSVRLKVLQDKGKEYANIEIPYTGKEIQLDAIRARTVDAQGRVSEFTDQVFDREIIKAKKYRVNAKVLALANVQVGTIIEYTYRLQIKEKIPDAFKHPEQYLVQSAFTYPAAMWPVQQDLFVRHAHFVLHKAGPGLREHNIGLPGIEYTDKGNGIVQLDLDNIAAYEEENYSPPEDALKARVDLFYAIDYFVSDGYWLDAAKRRAKLYESFLKKSKAIDHEAERLAAQTTTDEEKLRKIYARVQQIRAVSFEAEKTDKEKKRENLSENKNVEDVLNRGYAFTNQTNLLFVALARAAGFEAYPYMITSRKSTIFMPDWPNEYQLNAMVVQVRTSGGYIYLDPATKFCPYGLLPWDESDAGGIRIDAASPQRGFTPTPKSADAVKTRSAELRLTEEGALQGKVQFFYSGQEALIKRLEGIEQDEAARRKTLEDSLKSSLPQEASVNLLESSGWESSDGPLKATFEIDIPNFVTKAGKRVLFPMGVFHSNQSSPFASARRTNPIYFNYPQEEIEDVTVELPPGWRVESIRPLSQTDRKALYYEFSAKVEGNTVRFGRTLRFSGTLFEKELYPALRAFYDRVLAGDAEQMVLVPRAEKSPQ